MERAEVFPPVAVIVLNWNGWQDTIECLESVGKLRYPNYQVLIVDNGSTDDSVQKIKDWAKGKIQVIETAFPEFVNPPLPKPINFVQIENINKSLTDEQKKAKWFFLTLGENVGFARGMNTAIDFANQNLEVDYFYLLNNDTVVEPLVLDSIITAFQEDSSIVAAQSTIYYYSSPEKIANAGGKILPWGQNKYYRNINENEIKKITFINGCAFCLPKRTIENYGKLSEKFFFGEEDFEFSLRARKLKLKLVAVANSRVYHKFGAASKKNWKKLSQKVYITGLNRLIDVKDYLPKSVWYIWRFPVLFYFLILLVFKYGTPIKHSLKIIRKIYTMTKSINMVKKEYIMDVANE